MCVGVGGPLGPKGCHLEDKIFDTLGFDNRVNISVRWSFVTLVFAPAKSGSPTHSMKIFKSVGESDKLCAIFLCYIGGEI